MVSTARVSSPRALRTRLAPVKEVLAFASVALRSPSQVGAVTPASRWLARAIARELAGSGCRTVVEAGMPTAIVSSLPFRSMSPRESAPCISGLARALRQSAGSKLIQYSYGFGAKPPFTVPANGLRWARASKVLLNVPPATVWTLAHAERAGRQTPHA